MAKPRTTRTRKTRKIVAADGVAHIKATFNNTLITSPPLSAIVI
ncbi:MAG: 30S ribosomal protein S11, partial [Gemmatimonadetes bacterium]|nr:30S ribosomal protein S11 [Gemmatimonadota bacterium]